MVHMDSRIIDDNMIMLNSEAMQAMTDDEKIEALTRYQAAKRLMQRRTAKEYALIAVDRYNMNLPEGRQSDIEIMARRQKVESLKERAKRELVGLEAGKGDVAFVDESKDDEVSSGNDGVK